jgi:hypothetical protein
MKTTRIAAHQIGNKTLVQMASRGLDCAIDLLEIRVKEVRVQCRGGNGPLKQMGWPMWLWADAKEVLEEMRG